MTTFLVCLFAGLIGVLGVMEFRRAHTSLSAHSLSLGGYIHHIIQVEAGFPAGEKLRLMLLIVLRFCHPCGRTESGASFAVIV